MFITNTTKFNDTSVSVNTTYYYTICAVNDIGESDLSTEVNSTPTATIPGVPQSLTATTGDLYIYLEWMTPTSDGGSPITEYFVYRGKSSSNYDFIFVTNTTEFNDTTVSGGVEYYYVVTAINSRGESDPSTEESTAPMATVPSVPLNLIITPDQIFVHVNWTAPTSNGGSPITHYYVRRGDDSGNYNLVFITTSTEYNDTSVTGGNTYYYIVTATNAVGESDPSNEVNDTPLGPTAPDVPQSLTVDAGEMYVYLDWTAPVSNGGSPITEYYVHRGEISGIYSVTFVTKSTDFTDTSVRGNKTYYYVVTAVNEVGESSLSVERDATPSEGSSSGDPSPPPQNLVASAGELSVYLEWEASSIPTSSPSGDYLVWRGTSSGNYSLVYFVFGTNYTDTLVQGGTTYYYVVTGMDAQIQSSEVSAIPTSPSPVIVPGIPQSLSATA